MKRDSRNVKMKFLGIILIGFMLNKANGAEEFTVDKMFSDHMVLQIKMINGFYILNLKKLENLES